MINHEIAELAKIYGIEISNVESGKGGLFYTDSQGNKEILDTIFDSKRQINYLFVYKVNSLLV